MFSRRTKCNIEQKLTRDQIREIGHTITEIELDSKNLEDYFNTFSQDDQELFTSFFEINNPFFENINPAKRFNLLLRHLELYFSDYHFKEVGIDIDLDYSLIMFEGVAVQPQDYIYDDTNTATDTDDEDGDLYDGTNNNNNNNNNRNDDLITRTVSENADQEPIVNDNYDNDDNDNQEGFDFVDYDESHDTAPSFLFNNNNNVPPTPAMNGM